MANDNLKVPEKEVVKVILQYLEAKNIFAWRNNVGAIKTNDRFIRFGLKGSADIIGILPDGRFLGIECKTGKNKLSPAQDYFLKRVFQNGGCAIVAYSVDDVIQSALNKWKSNI